MLRVINIQRKIQIHEFVGSSMIKKSWTLNSIPNSRSKFEGNLLLKRLKVTNINCAILTRVPAIRFHYLRDQVKKGKLSWSTSGKVEELVAHNQIIER